MVVVVVGAGGGGGGGGGGGVDFSSLCSKHMFYILSVHQPAGMSYMI